MNDIFVHIEPPEEIKVKVSVDERKTQTKQVTPTEEGFPVTPDAGFLLERVDVAAVPWVRPQGSVTLTENGPADVERYAEAVVAVPDPVLQQRTVTPTEEQQTVEPQEGYDALSRVTVEPIPSEYIVPEGTKPITENGVVNVREYESANVQVPTIDTSDATAAAADIFEGKTAYVDGIKLTGTNSLRAPADGYFILDMPVETTNGVFMSRMRMHGTSEKIPNYCFYNISNSGFFSQVQWLILDAPIAKWEISAFSNVNKLKKLEFGASVTLNHLNMSVLEEVIFHGNVIIGAVGFSVFPTTMRIYDFSGCTQIPPLNNVSDFKHTNGCKIRIPYALSAEWQSSTGWRDLPTDPSVTGYVVWEGV